MRENAKTNNFWKRLQMKQIWLVVILMLAVCSGVKADSNKQALIASLQVKAQECYPDSRYIVVDQVLVPKPKAPPPQEVPVYVPAYVAPPPQVYLGFGYTYWGGNHGGHCGSSHGGGGHHGGHR
jgi:hypothetical protein